MLAEFVDSVANLKKFDIRYLYGWKVRIEIEYAVEADLSNSDIVPKEGIIKVERNNKYLNGGTRSKPIRLEGVDSD